MRLSPLLLASLGLLVHAAPATAAESFDACAGRITTLPAVITTQGVWCLDHDLSVNYASGTAILVAANNITIDCNGYKLGNLPAGLGNSATGIRADSRSNVVVRNCLVRGFQTGIALDGFGVEAVGNRLEGNNQYGIRVTGDASLVHDNRVLDTGNRPTGGDVVGIDAIGRADIFDNDVNGISCPVTAMNPEIECHALRISSDLDSLVARNRLRDVTWQFVGGFSVNYGMLVVEGEGQVRVVENHLPTGSVICESANTRVRGNSLMTTYDCTNDGNFL